MPKDRTYWITIALPARDLPEAEHLAKNIAGNTNAVIDVSIEPPQGSLIIGTYWDNEDGVRHG